MKLFIPAAVAVLLCAAFPAFADDARSERIQFPKGKTQTIVSGKITGGESIVYKVNAKDGQFLKVSMETDAESADFNIYIPGRGPGDEALFGSATGGRAYTGQLYKTGDHSISVFLNRNAARKGVTANFKLHVSVTARAPRRPSGAGGEARNGGRSQKGYQRLSRRPAQTSGGQKDDSDQFQAGGEFLCSGRQSGWSRETVALLPRRHQMHRHRLPGRRLIPQTGSGGRSPHSAVASGTPR